MKILKAIIKPFSLLDKYERCFVLVYLLTLVLGIWHALPNFNVVGDESPYVIGVLKAFQAHTVVPHIIYPYSISWYLSYLLHIPFLAIMLILQGSVSGLEHFVVYNQEVLYYIPRFITVISTLYLIAVFFLLAREASLNVRHKYVVAFLAFTNILFAFVAHTGKMWTLSLGIFVASFYFFDKTLRSDSLSLEKLPWHRNPLFYAILFPFLGMTNFAINMISLVNILVLSYVHYKNKLLWQKIIKFNVIGALVFGVFLLLNLNGWLTHGSMAPVVEGHHILDSLKFLTVYTFYTFPFVILLLALSLYKVKRLDLRIKVLVSYFLLYTLLIIIVAPWASVWPYMFLRYLLYPGFIITLMLLYVDIKAWKVSYVFVALSILFFLKTIYLLMLPTTYNLARTYIVNNLKDSLIVNNTFEINLPKSQAAYAMTDPVKCETKCKYVLEHEADKSEPGLLVIDSITEKDTWAQLKNSEAYIVGFESVDKPTAVFSNSLSGGAYVSMEHNLGKYGLDFIRVDRLGQPIYVYYNPGK
jgi:hypothetical protein